MGFVFWIPITAYILLPINTHPCTIAGHLHPIALILHRMSNEEDISHLERKIDQLQQHLAQQDAEILRISKVTDALVRRIERLEDRMSDSGIDSPVDLGSPTEDSPPPHY